jgi:hypothetical protein
MSFRDLFMGEIPPEAGKGQKSHVDKSLKRPVRETWNERKSIITFK